MSLQMGGDQHTLAGQRGERVQKVLWTGQLAKAKALQYK